MGDEVIKTGVDDLITFLEGKEKVPLLDAAAALSVRVDTLQSWVDFLVEEGIIGIEYKFTKPFIYLNKSNKDKAKIIGEEELSWDAYHRSFMEKASEKRIPDVKAVMLWKSHVLSSLEARKAFFYDEARKRQIPDIEAAWNQYKTEVLVKV
jgi:hypothetical protein